MELKPKKDAMIVTYGILLIVPYGIETGDSDSRRQQYYPFNCTLWN